MRKEKGEDAYLKSLPDSSIVLSAGDFEKYMILKQFESDPVVGVSWINARNYAAWKTDIEMPNNDAVYRLPLVSEWLWANEVVGEESSFMNPMIADWTLSAYYEGGMNRSNFRYDDTFIAAESDPMVFKRKRIIGNSFLMQQSNPMYHKFPYFEFEGYRNVGFRLVLSENNTGPVYNRNVKRHQLETEQGRIVYFEKEGRLHGQYTAYYPNGNKKAEGRFENNERVGNWSIWDTTGVLKMQRTYFNNFQYKSTFPQYEENATIQLVKALPYQLKRSADGTYAYYHVQEREVAWSRRIWRKLSLDENAFLSHVYRLLSTATLNNEIHVYGGDSDEFKTILKNDSIDFSSYKLTGFKLKEDVFIDHTRFSAEARIIGLCPIVKDANGNEKELCWWYYPEIRSVLTQYKMTPKAYQAKCWHLDDLFFFRHFGSNIVRATGTAIKDYKSATTMEALEKVQAELLEREHDFWLSISH